MTFAPLSVAYIIAIPKLFASATNVSHTRSGMTWQSGQTPMSPDPTLPTASPARPEPWLPAAKYDERSSGSLSSSKKFHPAMSFG